MTATAFIKFPTSGDNRRPGEVAIDIDEIASYEEFQVVSYTYERWTRVTLKTSGVQHECNVPMGVFEAALLEARLKVRWDAPMRLDGTEA